jgi:hypothetical protein
MICSAFKYKSKVTDWVAFFEQFANVKIFLDAIEVFRRKKNFKSRIMLSKISELTPDELLVRRLQNFSRTISKLTKEDFVIHEVTEAIFEKIVDFNELSNVVTIKWLGCPETSRTVPSQICDPYIIGQVYRFRCQAIQLNC